MKLTEIVRLCENPQELITRLQAWKVIPMEPDYKCAKCGGILKIVMNERYPFGIWYCENNVSGRNNKRKPCDTKVSVSKGTFFEKSKLGIYNVLSFVNYWVFNLKLYQINHLLDISQATAVGWSRFCAEIVAQHFLENSEMLGGEGKIVEIEESEFDKREGNLEKRFDEHWIFGGYERGSGAMFFAPVQVCSSDTLLTTIKKWIRPGTTIISDCWKAYDCVQDDGFEDLWVYQKIHFKDPEAVSRSNGIEWAWRAARVVNESGHWNVRLFGDLASYMFRKRCRDRDLNFFEEFLRIAGELFCPLKKGNEDLPQLVEEEEDEEEVEEEFEIDDYDDEEEDDDDDGAEVEDEAVKDEEE